MSSRKAGKQSPSDVATRTRKTKT